MIKTIEELPRRINEAFEIAMSGRPGPVLVDLPKDITASILHHSVSTQPNIPVTRSATNSSHNNSNKRSETIDRIIELINIAQRPVIYAGQGVIQSPDGPALLKELANRANIPVTTTLQVRYTVLYSYTHRDVIGNGRI